MDQQLQELTKLGNELKQGFTDLQKAQEKQAKDTDGLIKGEVDRVAKDLGARVEEMQQKQASYEAAMQRIADGTGTEKADDKEAKLKASAFIAFLRSKGDINLMKPEHVKAMATDIVALPMQPAINSQIPHFR